MPFFAVYPKNNFIFFYFIPFMDKLSQWIGQVTGSSSNPTPIAAQNTPTQNTPHNIQNPNTQPQQSQKKPNSPHAPQQNNNPHRNNNPNRNNPRKHFGNERNPNTPSNVPENSQQAQKKQHPYQTKSRSIDAGREVNKSRIMQERKTPTTPSKPVDRRSVSKMNTDRRERPRPMTPHVNRQIASRKYVQHETLPPGIPMRIIPLGGLNEVGKNSMCIEFNGDLLLIDIGLQFPEENMPGIDYVIPDLSYVIERKDKLKACLITHGHLDHIGGIHHYIEKLGFPTIYTTRLTKALIEKRLDEVEGLKEKVTIIDINLEDPNNRMQLGAFEVEFFRVNHSIPDASGIFIKTEAGSMIHTGDFKFDFTPADKMPCDYAKIIKFSQEGVDLIFADSTNATRDGFCPSEKYVSENIGRLIREAEGKRLILATFASSIGRHQAIIKHAAEQGRKVFLGGRSMNENIRIAHELGIIDVPRSAIKKLDASVQDYNPGQVLILTTGSQGEPFAALSRIARDEHPHIKINEDDIIAFSSSPIPGNERGLYTVIDSIHRKGASIITRSEIDIHASGHAFRGDLKMMHSLVKPKYIIPIHGEYFMRIAHRDMAVKELGYDERHAIMIENGSILELREGIAKKSDTVIPVELKFVDGKEHADLKEKQLQERIAMAEGGIITVLLELDRTTKNLKREPRVFSEGFLENPNVHGLIVDHAKISFAKVHAKYKDNITEAAVVDAVAEDIKLEVLREVARDPVVQIIVSVI